jgi:hypothetical protein
MCLSEKIILNSEAIKKSKVSSDYEKKGRSGIFGQDAIRLIVEIHTVS